MRDIVLAVELQYSMREHAVLDLFIVARCVILIPQKGEQDVGETLGCRLELLLPSALPPWQRTGETSPSFFDANAFGNVARHTHVDLLLEGLD